MYMFRSVKKIINAGEEKKPICIRPSGGIVLTAELIGYGVITPYGLIGSLEDLLIDEETGKVGFLILDTMGIFPENKLLLHAEAIDGMDKSRKYLFADTSIDEIRNTH